MPRIKGLADNYRYIAADNAINALKQGDKKWLDVHEDEYIKEYASQEDYEYWMQEQAKYRDAL